MTEKIARQIYSTEINEGNCQTIQWSDSYFKWCDLKKFTFEGGTICSDFANCTFSGVEWYWGIFTQTNFIQCQFDNCTFRGTSFVDVRFVECFFKNCRFIEDNLGCHCNFEESIAYGCKTENGDEFKVKQVL